jgi:hypothetical protein
MRARPVKVPTKIWLAVCLVMLALVPVFLPTASFKGFYRTPNSHRLQRHSSRIVADGQPEALSPISDYQSLPCLLSALTAPLAFNHRPQSDPAPSSDGLLTLLPHRRKLGHASPGDPDSLV